MSKAEEHIHEYYSGSLSHLEGIHKELVLKAMQSYADEQLKEAEEDRLFLSKRLTKEKRKANNAIYKLNKLKGFSEVEDSFDSFSGRSYVNIRYTDKTLLEIQSIRNMILDLNQQDNNKSYELDTTKR